MHYERRRYAAKDLAELRERVHIFQGLQRALERWPDVSALVFDATSPESLVQGLSELLDIDAVQATAVTQMQVQRASKDQRASVSEHLEVLQAELAQATERLGG